VQVHVRVCVRVCVRSLACVWVGHTCMCVGVGVCMGVSVGMSVCCMRMCLCVVLDTCMLEKKGHITCHVEHQERFDVVGVDSHQLIIPHHQQCLIRECISHPP